MYDEIVIALDGSAVAARAMTFASHFPCRRYRLIHVEPPFQRLAPGPLNEFRADWQEVVVHEVEAELRAQIGEAMAAGSPDGSDGSDGSAERCVDVRFGDVVEEIIAASDGADMTVMTTRGRGVAGRALFGSVSDQVARRGVRPTLLLRPDHPTERPRRVVVPLDGLRRAELALSPAIRLATGLGVPLVLVRVTGSEPDEGEPVGSSDDDGGRADPVAAAIEEATSYLARCCDEIAARHESVIHRVIIGETIPALIEIIDEGDVVVMASRALSGLSRLLLGSVAEQLVRHAPAPVLIVHDNVAGLEERAPSAQR